ncbi:Hypothetical protein SRAE_X000024600 [Strongyloides ratti]|uniref:Uncharacterized protein n=1 Tax=Strongyloides ratti TaxID=34506 RepID=A0A090LME6_STRRB|nr:Hypothetical protein SRAE_X000024600 [Strongyloides ratti]CEF70916.1 Hypothetical protein SRAE_X000024600 [Strongyloides ratti]
MFSMDINCYPHSYHVKSGGIIQESKIPSNNILKAIDSPEYYLDNSQFYLLKEKRYPNVEYRKNYQDIINFMDSLKRPRFGR